MNSPLQFIQFKLGEEDYAVPMEYVREIIKPLPFRKLLGAPEFILGVIKVRDDVIGIIDLRKKYRITSVNTEAAGEPRIVIIECHGGTIGLSVDDVVEILESDSTEKLAGMIHFGTIRDILKLNDKIIPVLDVNKLFSNEVIEGLSSNAETDMNLCN